MKRSLLPRLWTEVLLPIAKSRLRIPEVPAEERAKRVLAQAEDGQIVLLHDSAGNSATVEALRTIIPELKRRGFEFVTVPELFEKAGVTPARGIVYTSVYQKA